MENFEEILNKIIRPFREEYGQGCKNRSVIGGFDKYVLNWIEKAFIRCPARNDVKKHLESIKTRISRYDRMLPRERGELLKEIHPVIKAILDGNPLPPPPSEIKAGRESSRSGIIGKMIEKNEPIKPISLESPVNSISGVGPRLGEILEKAGLRTILDLIYHLPRDYRDYRQIKRLDSIEPGVYQIIGGTLGAVMSRKIKPRLEMTKAVFFDDFGSISLVWFNQPYLQRTLKPGAKYIVSGKVEFKYGQMQINTPEMEEDEGDFTGSGIVPIYPLTEGISQKFMRKIAGGAAKRYGNLIEEAFPEEFLKTNGLKTIGEAIKNIHFPENTDDAKKAVERLKFEEAFYLQLMSASYRRSFRKKEKDKRYRDESPVMDEFEKSLPFSLTGAQKRVIGEILEDMRSPFPMNRLLQGDVGSGKTIVCVIAALLAVDSGLQAAIMAPTEILAEQHYYRFKEYLEKSGIETGLLIGAMTPKEKDEVKSLLASGELHVAVGTHALIQEDVEFKNLAFAVVDEQHKFGVLQRAAFKEKGNHADFLFTTATPIPRSLCLTIYGDLDISVIDEIPPGRQPVKTMWIKSKEKERLYKFIEKEISGGGQVYVVCPLIEESEKVDATPLVHEFENLKNRFPDFSICLLHGRMKGEEKEAIMSDFASGKYRILVSTTVIEVGVDVPNASVMVILDANRFGLGQLHQLRGRVGRGKRKSYCALVADSEGEDSKLRLETLMKTNSGFEIAEADLRIRGPGDFTGVRQSGLPEFRFIDIVKDYKIMAKAREAAFGMEKEDPDFSKIEHMKIKENMRAKYKKIWDIIH